MQPRRCSCFGRLRFPATFNPITGRSSPVWVCRGRSRRMCGWVIATTSVRARYALAERLFNYIFWFDQMACGFPRVIAWIGDSVRCVDLPCDLYQRLTVVATRKSYNVETGVALAKFGYLNDMLASGIGWTAYRLGNELSVLELDPDVIGPPSKVMGGGMISHVVFPRVEDVVSVVDRATQTITHFGFEKERLVSLVEQLAKKGGFRVVPIGQALAFDTTWDCVPLLERMTRCFMLLGWRRRTTRGTLNR